MKDLLFSGVNNFRYERKFYIEGASVAEVESFLKFHPAMFMEIYSERKVNNIYLDSFEFNHYFDNVDGHSRRLKVRFRWYGDTFGHVANPLLELKLKHNLHVGKLSYRLNPFTVNGDFTIDTIRYAIRNSALHRDLISYLLGLNLVLLNSYNRKYFLSSDKKYRITIDRNMMVCALSHHRNEFLRASEASRDVILEIKYNGSDDGGVGNITNHFPFRSTRSSKYAAGVEKAFSYRDESI